jgi:hypothetical protein
MSGARLLPILANSQIEQQTPLRTMVFMCDEKGIGAQITCLQASETRIEEALAWYLVCPGSRIDDRNGYCGARLRYTIEIIMGTRC